MVLRILHLEDDSRDAALVAASLADAGIEADIHRVKTRAEFVAALAGEYDLVLSDYALPGFDGAAAQELASAQRPDLPFVFVSGTMGEEAAIQRLNAGATDYVLKQRLERLPSAVRRALQEAENQRERDRAEAEVRRLNAELEGRVVERTAQLASANQALAEHEAELRKTTAFLDSILENLPALVFVKDAVERKFVLFNREGEEILGIPRSEIIGRTVQDVFPAPIADVFARSESDILDGTPRDVVTADEVVASRARGPRILHTKRIPIAGSDGKPAYLVGISVDVTERRYAEEDARLAKLEAERANKAKSEFLSRMSHDLRTPLNAILGFAQLAESDESASAEQVDSARQILKGGAHLLELINEVLEISRIETGQLALSVEPVEIFELTREIVELIRPLAEARDIRVHLPFEGDCWVRADRQRLKQVLVNLLGNAVKYNHRGGEVRIEAARVAQRVRLRVSDTGPGIPAAKRALLFRPFERLGAEQGPVEGTGLGLALAKALIEAMGGGIGVEAPAIGATFWIELPESPTGRRQDRSAPADAASHATASTGTVLYVEDNTSNVRLLQRLLARRPGIRLVSVGTGAEGIAAAIADPPDLVMLDLHLPDMHGEAVLTRLLEDTRTRRIPVVVLSADATTAQSEHLLRAGARRYLTKPLVLSAVLDLIDEHLSPTRKSGAWQ